MYYKETTLDFISDTFSQILTNYLTAFQPTFPNANSPNSPTYIYAYASAAMDKLNQDALQTLANAVNGNTAAGLGQDMLYYTVNNLIRKPLIESSAALTVTVGPIYSSMVVQVSVSAVGGSTPYYIPTGWQVTSGTVTPTPAYTYTGTPIAIDAPGVFYLTVTSTDTSTAVPAFAINSGDAISGLTYTVTNPASAVLGSITLGTDWYVTASSLNNSPKYYPNTPVTIRTAGTYVFNVYSTDVSTVILAYQLNTASNNFLGAITNVINKANGLQGSPEETDAQFARRRSSFLTIEGQTYAGLKKAIADLNVPGLQGVAVAENISNSYNRSYCTIKATINYTGTPVVIPVGWTVYGTVTPTSPYATNQSYSYTTSGDQYIPVFSLDTTTSIPAGNWTSADAPYPTGITAVTNNDPAILGANLGLGQRGAIVYLNYPTLPYSYCDIKLTVGSVGVSPPYYIPVGWVATGPTTTSPYATNQSYAINATGVYTIRVFSSDVTTSIAIGAFTGGSAVSGLTFTVTNLSAGVLGQTNPGQFDVSDVYLQSIADTCANYLDFGAQYYSGGSGATVFPVTTSSDFTTNVILTPYQKINISCDLKLLYNLDPSDAGTSNGIFDASLLPTLQTQIQEIINAYFLSQSSNVNVIYTISQISQLLYSTYTGIVALIGNTAGYFSFGTLSPAQTGLLSLLQQAGYYYNLDVANFNFTAVNKDAFVP